VRGGGNLGRFVRGLVALSALAACRPAPKAESPAPSEATTDPWAASPRFPIEVADELTIAGDPIEAESVLIRKDGITLYSRHGSVGVSKTGARGDGGGGPAALGADGTYISNGTFVYGLVAGQALAWFGWEVSGSSLEDMADGTGLALARSTDDCPSCIYVTDGRGQAVKQYGSAGSLRGTLALPGTDPQGVAAARSGRIYVADAKHRRLLRVSPGLAEVDAIADLPAGAGGDVPTGLSFDEDERLFVCFRDRNVLLVLELPDDP
jgi:hypothetical protein